MRISISNLAWDITEDTKICEVLQKCNVDAIDIAPGKYFPQPALATDQEIKAVKEWWSQRSVEITGMQALLFGTTGLNVFGSDESRQQMLNHLTAVCRIAADLGSTKLVFGSPKNRDRGALSDIDVIEISNLFFRKLGDIAKSYGVIVCLEPNPTRYGANFMINTSETAAVIKRIDHSCIKMQLDLGAMTLNAEQPDDIKIYSDLYGHVHASEPDLIPLGDNLSSQHDQFSKNISKYLPNQVVTIEMLATKNELHEISVTRALIAAKKFYGDKNV